MNNFKALQAQQMALFAEKKQEQVFDRVAGTMDVFRFLGAIVEMYVPVMANTVVGLTSAEGTIGGDLPRDNSEPPLGGRDGTTKPKPSGPEVTGDIVR